MINCQIALAETLFVLFVDRRPHVILSDVYCFLAYHIPNREQKCISIKSLAFLDLDIVTCSTGNTTNIAYIEFTYFSSDLSIPPTCY